VIADAEHEEDDANLRKLRRKIDIGDESGSEWAKCHTGEQVPDDRRETKAHCHQAAQEGHAQPDSKDRNQLGLVRHNIHLVGLPPGR
jgi:hypothetical protein